MGIRDRIAPGSSQAVETSNSPGTGARWTYKVETVRSKLVGDRVEGGEVEKLLNKRAREGWRLKSVTETEVKGRLGPGGTMGLLLIFEREG